MTQEIRVATNDVIECLQRIVVHDIAADHREGLEWHCAEVEAACWLLLDLGMFPPGTNFPEYLKAGT